MSRTVQEVIDEIESLEDVGTPENMARAKDLRTKLEDAGYSDLLNAQSNEPEQSFWDQWGRPITEGAGALAFGAAGLPLGGIPGMMAGAALGGHIGGMGYDYLGGEEVPSPKEQVIGAGFNMFGGPTPIPSKAPGALKGMVPEGNLFDVGTSTGGVPTVDDIVAERGGRLTSGTRNNPAAARMEGWSESSPFTVDLWTANREANVNVLDELVTETTPRAASRNVAGSRAGIGYEEVVDASYQNVGRLYDKLDEILKRSGGSTLERISMDELQKLMHNFDELVKRDGKFARMVYQDPDLNSAIEAMRDMLRNEQLAKAGAGMEPYGLAPDTGPIRPTYEVIKRLRTIIGNKIDDAFNQTGEKSGQKLLYNTLSDDLESGVRQIGGEPAVAAREAADAANTKLKEGMKYLKKIFNDNTLDNPERLYEALATRVVSDPDRVREAKRVLPKADWDRFVDTYIRRLSLARPGAQDITGELVSPRTTVTNIADLKKNSPEGYKLIIEGKEEAIEVIEELAQRLVDAEKYLNRSNTAGALMQQQFVSELTTGGAGLGAGLLAGGPTAAVATGLTAALARPFIARAMAKALTNDVFARALTKVKRTYRDGLPQGMDLAKALIAAGADEADVQEVMWEERPPLTGAE